MGLAHDYIQFQCLQIHFHNISSGLIISICKNELNLRSRSEPRSFARGHCSASHLAKSFAGTEDAPFEKTWISGPQEFLIFIKFIFFFCLGCLWHHMYVSVESYDRILEKEVFFWYGFGPLWMDVFSAFQWPLSGCWPFLRPSSQYPVKISM